MAIRRPIILYHPHRQIFPIVADDFNKKTYKFINYQTIWRALRIFGKTSSKSKLRFFVYSFVLNFIKPKYILEINWIGRLELFHYLYARKSVYTSTIVVQHGSYFGGFVTARDHKMLRCNYFWVWGNYWADQFITNKGLMIFKGNPVYNGLKKKHSLNLTLLREIKKILVVISYEGITYQLEQLCCFLKVLETEVVFKIRDGRDYDELRNRIVSKGGDFIKLVNENNFDFVITDFSTTALDCHFLGVPFVIIFDSNYNLRFNQYIQDFECVDLAGSYPSKEELILKGKSNLCKPSDLYTFAENSINI